MHKIVLDLHSACMLKIYLQLNDFTFLLVLLCITLYLLAFACIMKLNVCNSMINNIKVQSDRKCQHQFEGVKHDALAIEHM